MAGSDERASDSRSTRRSGVVECRSWFELTPLCRSKSRRPHHRITDGCADALELPLRDPFGGSHPRSPARHDVLEREVALEVRAGDSAAGIELHAGERSRKQLEIFDAAQRCNRPQLQQRKPRIDRGFDLARGGNARKDRNVALETIVNDGAIESRRYHEVRAGLSRLLCLPDVEHSAGSSEHFWMLVRNPTEGFEGARC